MIYMYDGDTGTTAIVRDTETGKLRYANHDGEIANWTREVEVNGAWITARTYDGRHITIRSIDSDWYDADHTEFMESIQTAQAALKRMLAARGLQTEA